VTVVLRRRAPVPDVLIEGPDTLSAAQLGAEYGAEGADVDVVRDVLGAAGLTVTSVDAPSRRMQVSGSAAAVAAVFGTTLTRTTSPDPVTGAAVDHRQRTGELTVPAVLDGIVVAVLGIDDRPQARAQFRIATPPPDAATPGAGAPGAAAPGAGYTPPQLGQAYAFPTGTDGTGQSVALVELGGGYAQSDLDAYFTGLGLGTPAVSAVGVDGGVNAAGKDPHGADGEVLLDIEVAGALAPKATLVVYFAPNTDRGFLDAVATAVHATPTPTAVSISWGKARTRGPPRPGPRWTRRSSTPPPWG